MQIRIYGDDILRKKCKPIAKIGDEEREILDQMVKKMRESGGVGLAACQVGLNRQLLVVDLANKALKLANPKICKRAGKQVIEEGCLSLPQIQVKVKRSKKIKLEALDEHNQQIFIDAEDLLAIVLQHEIDHLHGKMIIDYLPWYKKIKAIKALKEYRRRMRGK